MRGILGDVLKGLSYAADSSIIHRDIKPANIFIDVAYNADVAPDLDGEPDLEKRLEALISRKRKRHMSLMGT